MYNLTKLILDAKSIGVTVYFVPAEDNAAKAKQGIHLLMPSEYELEDALNTAERDGFKTIFIHNQF
jgi:hypothetical protein